MTYYSWPEHVEDCESLETIKNMNSLEETISKEYYQLIDLL